MTLVVDALIGLVLAEALLLCAWHRLRGRGLPPRELLPNLLAGALLMLALRCALTPGWAWAALACLAGAGLSHAVDLARRLAARRGAGLDTKQNAAHGGGV
jgi:hypothetical protein